MRVTLCAALKLSLVVLGCSDGANGSGGSNGADGGADEPLIILDGGGAIPEPPDGEQLCPGGVCNYQSSAGCLADKPSCVPALLQNNAVAPSCEPAGSGTSGASCSAWKDCAAGHICVAGECRELCCGGDWTGCASSSEHCIRTLQLQGAVGEVIPTGAMLCYPVNTCDALAPSSCSEPGTTCQIVDATGATACFPEGTGASGEPCPCEGGFLCVKGQCRRLCKAVAGGGEPSCASGEGICVHFNRDPPAVGECTR